MAASLPTPSLVGRGQSPLEALLGQLPYGSPPYARAVWATSQCSEITGVLTCPQDSAYMRRHAPADEKETLPGDACERRTRRAALRQSEVEEVVMFRWQSCRAALAGSALGAASVILTPVAWGAPALADDTQPMKTTVLGYSPQGMFAVVAEGLSEVVRREYPGSSFVYEPSNPAGAVTLVAKGEQSFALSTTAELRMAIRGDPPFQAAFPKESLRPIMRVGDGFTVYVYARKAFLEANNISSLADVKARKLPMRISVNQAGNLLGQEMSKSVLDYYGISYADVGKWGGEVIYLATRASNDLMRDGKLDVIITGGFVPNSQIMEIANTTPIKLLTVPPVTIEKLMTDFGAEPYTIPRSAYPDLLDQDLPSVAFYFVLSGGPSATDRDAYKLAKAFHRQFDYYKTLHPAFSKYSPASVAKIGSLPLHPGAAQYYREVGLLGKE